MSEESLTVYTTIYLLKLINVNSVNNDIEVFDGDRVLVAYHVLVSNTLVVLGKAVNLGVCDIDVIGSGADSVNACFNSRLCEVCTVSSVIEVLFKNSLKFLHLYGLYAKMNMRNIGF